MGTERRHYTEEERNAALTLAADIGRWKASRQLTIPYATLAGWENKAANGNRRPRPMGAPTSCTPDVQARAVEALAAGNTIQGACEYAGITSVSYRNWCQRADAELERRAAIPDGTDDPDPDLRDREERFVTFADTVRNARAAAKQEHITLIQRAARGGAVVERRTVTYPDGRVEVHEKLARAEWQAAAWIMERTYTDEYGRRNRVDHAGRIDSKVETVSLETQEERVQVVGSLRDDLATRRAERAGEQTAPAADAAAQ